MVRKHRYNSSTRIVAGVLSVIWICAGFAAFILGMWKEYWPAALMGPCAIWYGLIWARVSYEGRRLKWPNGLLPWKRDES